MNYQIRIIAWLWTVALIGLYYGLTMRHLYAGALLAVLFGTLFMLAPAIASIAGVVREFPREASFADA